MRFHVNPNHVLLAERPSAHVASKRPLAPMHLLVPLQIILPQEALSAVRAYVRLGAVVDILVSL